MNYQLEKMDIACGRDRFFQILGENGLLVYHSDRGSQYCSNLYTEFLIQNHIQISMAETGNCYQNALAERVDGILKMAFEMASGFPSKSMAIQVTPKAIHDYNCLRPHLNLNYNNPQTVFDTSIQNINKQFFVP